MNVSGNIINATAIETHKNNYVEAKQSANVLFKFMKKMDYLKEILRNKAMMPRYYEESIEYLEIEGYEKIVFPMICFCDINLSKLQSHVKYYGEFGIAFKKEWGIGNNIQPIHYMNENSEMRNEFSQLFSISIKNISNDTPELDGYNNYLLTHLLYMKPLCGMMRRDEKYDIKNFTDEKEWRFIPKISDEDKINLILPKTYTNNQKAYNAYSDGLRKLQHLWLHFEYKDIEYLMVENEIGREELIKFILEDTSICCKETEKFTLISKITVYNVMNKDW